MDERTLEEAIVEFPGFVFSVIVGLLKAVLTESDAFLVLVLGVLLAVLTAPLVGVAAGLGLYLVMRLVAQAAGLVAKNLNLLAAVIRDREKPSIVFPSEEVHE